LRAACKLASSTVGFNQYLIVPKPHDKQSFALQRLGSRCVQFRRVLRTIEFDNQSARVAMKIHNVGWQRVLAAKPEALEMTSPQVIPEVALGIRGGIAQPFGRRQSRSR